MSLFKMGINAIATLINDQVHKTLMNNRIPEYNNNNDNDKFARVKTYIDFINEQYLFLVFQYGFKFTKYEEYTTAKPIPLFIFIKYDNTLAERCIEMVINTELLKLHQFIMKTENGKQPEYNDKYNCLSFYELKEYLGDKTYNNEPNDTKLSFIKNGRNLLTPAILTGQEWPNESRVDSIKQQKSGYHLVKTHSLIIDHLKFLIDEYNFAVVHDYILLRPFELGMGGEVIYKKDELELIISLDFRDGLLGILSNIGQSDTEYVQIFGCETVYNSVYDSSWVNHAVSKVKLLLDRQSLSDSDL